jgi:hypothetical protein
MEKRCKLLRRFFTKEMGMIRKIVGSALWALVMMGSLGGPALAGPGDSKRVSDTAAQPSGEPGASCASSMPETPLFTPRAQAKIRCPASPYACSSNEYCLTWYGPTSYCQGLGDPRICWTCLVVT